MSAKHLFFLLIALKTVFSSDFRDNNRIDDCTCTQSHVKSCPEWLSEENCLRIGGQFVRKDTEDCLCCPECHVHTGLFGSCSARPGLQVRCSSGLYCSAEFRCLPIGPGLTRVRRGAFRIGLGKKEMSVEGETHGKGVAVSQRSNTISGGNANSINNNLGNTFIINNNYRIESRDFKKPFKQRIRVTNDSLLMDHLKDDDSATPTPDNTSTTATADDGLSSESPLILKEIHRKTEQKKK